MKIKKFLLGFITDYLDKVKPNEFLFISGDTYGNSIRTIPFSLQSLRFNLSRNF